jgi:hypothetical protein
VWFASIDCNWKAATASCQPRTEDYHYNAFETHPITADLCRKQIPFVLYETKARRTGILHSFHAEAPVNHLKRSSCQPGISKPLSTESTTLKTADFEALVKSLIAYIGRSPSGTKLARNGESPGLRTIRMRTKNHHVLPPRAPCTTVH